MAIIAVAQTPSATGVIRLRVRVGAGDGGKAKGLARKRFFLVRGSLEQNKALLDSINRHSALSRDCFYRGIGASEALIAWLKEGDCESVHCRAVDQKDVEGTGAVPEFQQAVAVGVREHGNPELARKWLAVNLPENLRSGFYKHQQQNLEALIVQAEAQSGARVSSVMTDLNGTAYFTDVDPGVYVISNLLPTEVGSATESWRCEVKVAAGDLATATREKPFLISNPGNNDPRDKKNIKCVSVQRTLPVCETAR